jgi:hypothetical protein
VGVFVQVSAGLRVISRPQKCGGVGPSRDEALQRSYTNNATNVLLYLPCAQQHQASLKTRNGK